MDRDLHRAHAELADDHWWFVGRRAVIMAVITRRVGATAAIADLGCGPGGMLPPLAELGSVWAVEADRDSAAVARRTCPAATVVTGELPGALDRLPLVDLVTLLDVIEHVDDDVGLLERAAQLCPGGHLCVTVPALPWLWSEHDDRNGHKRRYTRASLRSALEQAGLQVEHISYFNSFLLPLVVAARLVQRLTGRVAQDDFSHGAGRLGSLLASVFTRERQLVAHRGLPIGVSLIAIARPDGQ